MESPAPVKDLDVAETIPAQSQRGLMSSGQTLDWAREMADPWLRRSVDRLAGPIRTVASYHFGWCDERGDGDGVTLGKAVRPALTLLSAEAVGVPAARAAVAAAAIELVHNMSLLHDDIVDDDRMRRHRPTAWSVFGVPAAILTGDALLVSAFDILAQHSVEGVGPLAAVLVELCNGETADIEFERRTEVDIEECVAMAGNKTASLLACACALGALAGGSEVDADRVHHIRQFGHHLGLAFQLVDDLLGIWGDPARTGKPACRDLRAGKKSLPVVAALATNSAAAHRLAALYLGGKPLSDNEVVEVAALVDLAGGRAWTQRETSKHIGLALAHLDKANPEPGPAAQLTALAHLLTRRDH